MRRAVFADPRIDFVFQRIFGSEHRTSVLFGFLNDVLGLDQAHRITEVAFLPPEQRPKVSELKYAIVGVKCVDATGTTYVVEMQVLNVEAFEKRVVSNVAKATAHPLDVDDRYPKLNDVIGISICDVELWPRRSGEPQVPMLSRWRMQEPSSGELALSQLQFVFLELPKYDTSHEPETVVERWAYFFREARHLTVIPPALQHPPLIEALEAARLSKFTMGEWDAYIAAGMAIQNKRGALSLARKEGLEEGHKAGLEEGRRQGLCEGIEAACDLLGLEIDAARRAQLDALDPDALKALFAHLRRERRWP